MNTRKPDEAREVLIQSLKEKVAKFADNCDYIELIDEPGVKVIHTFLYYGQKLLTVSIGADSNASTYIENIISDIHKEKNETSVLYSTAREIMIAYATLVRRDISYTFETKNDSMRNWAGTRGKQIFQWNIKDPFAGYDELFSAYDLADVETIYKVIIHPQEYKSAE